MKFSNKSIALCTVFLSINLSYRIWLYLSTTLGSVHFSFLAWKKGNFGGFMPINDFFETSIHIGLWSDMMCPCSKYPAFTIFNVDDVKISSIGFVPLLYVPGIPSPCLVAIAGYSSLSSNLSLNTFSLVSQFQSPATISCSPFSLHSSICVQKSSQNVLTTPLLSPILVNANNCWQKTFLCP